MSRWVLRGLRSGIVTTRYPDALDPSPGTSPGLPRATPMGAAEGESLVDRCPTGALGASAEGVRVDARHCVHCMRCHPSSGGVREPLEWREDPEWARVTAAGRALEQAFGRSLHLRFVDAGGCGACIAEARHLNKIGRAHV